MNPYEEVRDLFTLEQAMKIAFDAHTGQTRKNGEPYICHPLRVMFQMTTETEKICAVLHDVVEDTTTTLKNLIDQGCGMTVACALSLLTHEKGISYFDYIKSIRESRNEIAIRIKMADLRDNMNLSQLPEITYRDIERTQKYVKALAVLIEAERELE